MLLGKSFRKQRRQHLASCKFIQAIQPEFGKSRIDLSDKRSNSSDAYPLQHGSHLNLQSRQTRLVVEVYAGPMLGFQVLAFFRRKAPSSIASLRPPASSNVTTELRPSLSILNHLSMNGSSNPLAQQNAFPITGISSPSQSSSRRLEAISSCRSIDFIQRHSKMSIMSEMLV